MVELRFVATIFFVCCYSPWVRMMIPFCGMELNHRAMDRHIEFEPNHMLNHYYMIRETCASPLLCILDVLKVSRTTNCLQFLKGDMLSSKLVVVFKAFSLP